ncbi:hypothetical protein BHM03_00015910 [Ensete ventricosum]|nr:hypothetical protein BHM03_00015910 [Ensete ventricosum]
MRPTGPQSTVYLAVSLCRNSSSLPPNQPHPSPPPSPPQRPCVPVYPAITSPGSRKLSICGRTGSDNRVESYYSCCVDSVNAVDLERSTLVGTGAPSVVVGPIRARLICDGAHGRTVGVTLWSPSVRDKVHSIHVGTNPNHDAFRGGITDIKIYFF